MAVAPDPEDLRIDAAGVDRSAVGDARVHAAVDVERLGEAVDDAAETVQLAGRQCESRDLLVNGEARLVTRRESYDDLLATHLPALDG